MDARPDLVLERIFACPRSRLWRAFTDETEFSSWFGPDGWTVDEASVEIHAVVGGLQRYSMRSTDNQSVSSVTGRFVEVEPESLLVSNEAAFGAGATDSVELTLRLQLEDVESGTRLRLHQGPFPYGVTGLGERGWLEAFAKLDRLLASG